MSGPAAKIKSTVTLTGLAGIAADKYPAEVCQSLESFLGWLSVAGGALPEVCLATHVAAVAAGKSASMTVWVDDANRIHCQFARYKSVLDERIADGVEHASNWVKTWWPNLRMRTP